MKNYFYAVVIVAGLTALVSGCGQAQEHAHDNSRKKVHYDAKTGRYYYVAEEKDARDKDDFCYYWLSDGGSGYYTTPTFSRLSPGTLSSGSWTRGNPPEAYASRAPTIQELDNPAEATEVVEVEQANTQENLGIPDENSLDSMEGVPEASEGMSADASSDSGSSSGDTGGDGGGGDGGGGGDD